MRDTGCPEGISETKDRPAAEAPEGLRPPSAASGLVGLLAQRAEQVMPGASCLVLAADAAGGMSRMLWAGRLPHALTDAIETLLAEPGADRSPDVLVPEREQLVPDIASDTRWRRLQPHARRHGLHACWSAPLRHDDGRLLGAFLLFFRDAAVPDTAAIDELRVLARITAGAMALGREIEAGEHAARLGSTIVRVLSRFMGQGDLRGRAGELVRELAQITGSAHALLAERIRDGDGERLHALAHTFAPVDDAARRLLDGYAREGLVSHRIDGLLGRPAVTGEIVIANDIGSHPGDVAGLPPPHFPVRNFLGVPLRQDDQVIGVLGLVNRPGGFDRDWAARLEPVFSVCAGMIAWLRDDQARRSAERRAEHERALLRLVLENLPDPIAIKDGQGRYLECNPVFADFVGMTRDTVIGARARDIFEAGTADRFERDDRRAIEAGEPVSALQWLRHARSGERRLVHIRKLALRNDDGEVRGILMAARDITDLHLQSERERLASEVFASTAEGLAVTDSAGRLVSVNPALVDMLGRSESELAGQDWRTIDPDLLRNRVPEADGLPPEGLRGEGWLAHVDGSRLPVWRTVTAVRDAQGDVSHYVLGYLNITELVLAREHLDHLAHHDSLTGLPNRVMLIRELNRALARSRFAASSVAVILLDIDSFKTVNDSLGHHIGDHLLNAVAERLRAHIRDSDVIARVGGDEFVLVLESLKDPQGAERVAAKVMAAFDAAFEVSGHSLYLSPSIGISLSPGDGEDAETLLRNADTAMYAAKAAGRSTYRFYSRDLTLAAAEQLAYDNALRTALAKGEFVLNFQPVIGLRDGRMVAAEVLLRWHSETLGSVSPDEFIPKAEASGLIVPIGDWVLSQAIAQAARWRAQGMPHLRIAVNVSMRQLDRGGFDQRVFALLGEHGLPADALEVEVTESVLADQGSESPIIRQLQALRERGVSVAIDDFGTGYSSLARLQKMPVDRIKIDRAFISGNDSGAEPSRAIARAIAAIAAELGLSLTAEGIEDASHASFAQLLGCDEVQGWWFGRPATAEVFERQLRASASLPSRD